MKPSPQTRKSGETSTGQTERLAWLQRVHQGFGAWAAALSWWRMAALGLIALIAGSWIAERLQLSHERVSVYPAKTGDPSQSDKDMGVVECIDGDKIRIGGSRGIVIGGSGGMVICDVERSGKTAPASASGASAPAGPLASSEVKPATRERHDASDGDDDPPRVVRHTLGGWIGDLLSAALIALFAYMVAAKVILRKTAEADAKLLEAHGNAEREAIQRQLVQARLKLLQAQVEPHFLFNTLAAVDYLIETDAKRASVMQKTLISYLRAALPQMRKDSSTLGREVALIRAYLELLKLRIEERLEFDIQIPGGLASAVFPPMVLQSLVENAVRHGIEPKPEGGRISVRAEVKYGQLCVEVADTGVGLPNGDLYGDADSGHGFGLGLDNIRNRLAVLYPGASRLDLCPGPSGGAVATVTVPYRHDAALPENASRDEPAR